MCVVFVNMAKIRRPKSGGVLEGDIPRCAGADFWNIEHERGGGLSFLMPLQHIPSAERKMWHRR